MPSWVESILKSDVKGKEKVTLLAGKLVAGKSAIADVIEYCQTAKGGDKGHCVEALTLITEQNPKLGEFCLAFAMTLLDDKLPRVKWEASHLIGNVAKEYPEQTAKAIPALLANSEDEGTVVRWSTANALTEIAKANPKTRAKLVPFFEDKVASEENNGVNKIYAKALKALKKS
jgi:hypothetical protein